MGHACASGALVLRVRAAGLYRRILWIQAGIVRIPGSNIQHPAHHSGATVVPLAVLHRSRGRHPTVWRLLRRALLHPIQHVDEPILLRVRVHSPGVPDPHHHMRRDHHRALLLPAVRGELPMVVALVPGVRVHSTLRLPILGRLLYTPRGNVAVTYLLYFGYMGLLCFAGFLMCGVFGFSATYWFVTK